MSIGEQIERQVIPRARPVVVFGESLTKQAFKDEVNINKIIAKHSKTGMVNHLNKNPGFYDDVSEITSYQESLEIVQKAQEMFENMPSDVRAKFKNDPQNMVAFLADEKNEDEAIRLGLRVQKNVEKGPEMDVDKRKERNEGKGS